MRTVPTLLAIVVVAAACSPDRRLADAAPRYTPRARRVTITAVPLLVRELAATYPFLAADFRPGGVLDGKEVYGFSPSTITVVAGDTIHFTFYNPEDDDHAFVLHDLYVPLPHQTKRETTYVARTPGVYDFTCSVPSHLPMMRGELVVLAPASVVPSNLGPPAPLPD